MSMASTSCRTKPLSAGSPKINKPVTRSREHFRQTGTPRRRKLWNCQSPASELGSEHDPGGKSKSAAWVQRLSVATHLAYGRGNLIAGYHFPCLLYTSPSPRD